MADKMTVLDDCFGELLDEMVELGIADNTLVVFMADNGLMIELQNRINDGACQAMEAESG